MAGFQPINEAADAPEPSTFNVRSTIEGQSSPNAFPMYPAMALPSLGRSYQPHFANLGRDCQYECCPTINRSINHGPHEVAQASNAVPKQRPTMSMPTNVPPETFTFPVWRAPLGTHDTSTERPTAESVKREDIILQHRHSFPTLLPTVDECRAAPINPEFPCRPLSQLQSPVHLPETYPAASVLSSVLFPTISTSTSISTYTRQIALFTRLEAICTIAAQTYWRSQCASAFNKPPLSLHPFRGGHRHPPPNNRHPYDTGRTQPRTLAGCIARISQMLWERATASGDHAKELEAVHRMGNLYAWSERVVAAARAEEEVGRAEVEECAVAARDLSCWLLSERGKEEVEQLRREWGV